MSEVRLDIRARVDWEREQQAFLDVRVFDPKATVVSRNE